MVLSCKCPDNFNPLPRKEGDAGLSKKCRNRALYFNPLPRKEGDKSVAIVLYEMSVISIHSLVKRETQAYAETLRREQFQSTPS